MKRIDYIKKAILKAVKDLDRERKGWVYTRNALRQAAAGIIEHHITETEFTEALQALKKENKIHKVTTYS